MAVVTKNTTIAELRAIAQAATSEGPVSPQLIRSVQQSMRVEGYDVSEETIRRIALEVFSRST